MEDINKITRPITITYKGLLSSFLKTGGKGKKRKSSLVLVSRIKNFVRVEVGGDLLIDPKTGNIYYDDLK